MTAADPHQITFLSLGVYGTGGVPRTVLTLAGHLARRGHQVGVTSVTRAKPTPSFPVPAGVTLHWLEDNSREGVDKPVRARNDPSRSRLARWLDTRPTRLTDGHHDPALSLLTDLQLRRWLRTLPSGVLIATRPELAVAATRWAKPRVRVIVQEHLAFQGRPAALREALRDASDRLAALLTLTSADVEGWRHYLGPDSDTLVRAIPNTSPFVASEPAPLTSKTIVAAGRLVPRKGFDELIEAFTPLTRTHPDWQLHIYGKGRLHAELAAQIERLGVGTQVQLKGFTDQFEAGLAEAAVFAMSSHREGLPMVLLEAMSKGVPMVSFDCPEGPRQLIEHGVNGLLVEDHDVSGLGAALAKVMDDAELRARYGAAALASAATYLPDRVCEQWESLFDEVGAPALRA